MLAINCMPDHVHIFIGARPALYIPDLIKDIKTGSTRFINENKWCKGHFGWQEGYGVFSYTYTDVKKIIQYVLNQEEHHKKITFRNEYLDLLKEFNIDYDERYTFENYEHE
jgi:REP element-mobilizing transposase RayT